MDRPIRITLPPRYIKEIDMKKIIESYKIIRPNWDAVGGGYIQCNCGSVLANRQETRQHWQEGHFDTTEPTQIEIEE